MNDWKNTALEAVENAKALNLEFRTILCGLTPLNGPCKLVGVVLEADDQYDAISLPVYLIKTASGEITDAYDDELFCEDSEQLATLINAVSIPFSIARQINEFESPDALLTSGSEEEKALFQSRLAAA